METIDSKIEEYTKIRDSFLEKTKSLQQKIRDCDKQANDLLLERHRLKSKIEKLRPRIEGADKYCNKCDIISMKYSHSLYDSEKKEGQSWYECIVCNHTCYVPDNSDIS